MFSVTIMANDEIEATVTYRRIPVISPGLLQFRKGFWVGL